MNLLTRPEYTSIDYRNLGLDKDKAQGLQRFLRDKGFGDVLEFGLDEVHTTSFVGVIKYGDLQLNIVPKIIGNLQEASSISCLKNLIFMLRYVRKLNIRNIDEAELGKTNNPFLEVLIAHYANTLLDALHRHIPHHYETHKENLNALRGKIVFTQHIKNNATNQARIYCCFDEFTANNVLNQILKYVAYALSKITQVSQTYNKLKKILAIYEDVSLRNFHYEESKKVILNRNQTTFNEPLKLAQMFLEHSAISFHEHTFTNLAILFDMNLLFEEFVANVLVEKFGSEYVKPQKPKEIIAKNDEFPVSYNVKPDILFKDKIIIDTKYKILDLPEKKPSSADIYQMLSYAHFYPGYRDLILCYPKYRQEYSLKLPLKDTTDYQIFLLTVDLSQPLTEESIHTISKGFETFL